MIYYLKTKASSNPLRPRLKGNNKKRSDDMDKKIKGVIVSEYPFEDNSKIINIFTENGLLGVIAKGAKKVRSPFLVLLLNLIMVVLILIIKRMVYLN